MSFSDYLENRLLNHIFGNVLFTAPTICVGLAHDVVEDVYDEVSGGGSGYNRVITTPADWSESTTGKMANAVTLTFPDTITDWGEVSYFILVDTATLLTGNLLAYGRLQVERLGVEVDKTWFIEEGSFPFCVPGQLEIFLD